MSPLLLHETEQRKRVFNITVVSIHTATAGDVKDA